MYEVFGMIEAYCMSSHQEEPRVFVQRVQIQNFFVFFFKHIIQKKTECIRFV